jgi:hypothetical protein
MRLVPPGWSALLRCHYQQQPFALSQASVAVDCGISLAEVAVEIVFTTSYQRRMLRYIHIVLPATLTILCTSTSRIHIEAVYQI